MTRKDERKFDGIILPLPYRSLSDRDRDCLGYVMGISGGELGSLGPGNIEINYATLPKENMKNIGLFWLEGCPEDSGPYSIRGCYNWLLPSFSRISDTEKASIRVRPAKEPHPRYYDYDVVFWHDGKAVPIGQQYVFGKNLFRFSPDFNLLDAIREWEEERYDSKFSHTLEWMKSNLDSIIAKFPRVIPIDAERKIQTAARDAGWPNQEALMQDVV